MVYCYEASLIVWFMESIVWVWNKAWNRMSHDEIVWVEMSVQGTICWGLQQLRQCIACNNATDIELHVHTYAVGVADIAAHEGSPHNVLHSSSIFTQTVNKRNAQAVYTEKPLVGYRLYNSFPTSSQFFFFTILYEKIDHVVSGQPGHVSSQALCLWNTWLVDTLPVQYCTGNHMPDSAI